MYASQSKEYLINKAKTASPIELVIMLYDAAIKNIDLSSGLMSEKSYIASAEKLNKAKRCVHELRRALDMEKGEQIASNLFSIYRYVDKCLTNANLYKSNEELERAKKMLSELRETWQQIAKDNPSGSQNMQHSAGVSYLNTYT